MLAALIWDVQCKQLSPKQNPSSISSVKHIFSNAKLSGLSAVPPAALLSSQFLVEPASARNVTTQVGQTTYLHCIVGHLDDKTVGARDRQVSWIRIRDFHLLTVGTYTYTSDARFQTLCNEYCTDWALQIKYPQPHDEGLYECQISSDPPISHHVYLKVLVPKTRIDGGPNFYVGVGSQVNLTCIISDCPEPPAFVFWYHDNRMINYDSSRGQISTQKAFENTAISRLFIRSAQTSDSGNYSCCPSNAEAASIFVHVVRGEKHAAVQNDASSTSNSSTRFLSSLLILTALEMFLTLHSICRR